jgi:hypothetical protein
LWNKERRLIFPFKSKCLPLHQEHITKKNNKKWRPCLGFGSRAFQIPTLAPKEMPGRTASMSERLQSINKELEKKTIQVNGP